MEGVLAVSFGILSGLDEWLMGGSGFVPCFLRAFPANAVALLVFESVMKTLP